MKSKTNSINIELKNEVLGIVDQLYSRIPLLDRESNNISLQIVESISGAYAELNCGNHFAFEEILLPHLKKMSEDERLQVVKDLFTVGFVDIAKERIFMRVFPYLNKVEDEPNYPYVTDIPAST
jgi:hypothetical protein